MYIEDIYESTKSPIGTNLSLSSSLLEKRFEKSNPTKRTAPIPRINVTNIPYCKKGKKDNF
jgi:hypothetical protein